MSIKRRIYCTSIIRVTSFFLHSVSIFPYILLTLVILFRSCFSLPLPLAFFIPSFSLSLSLLLFPPPPLPSGRLPRPQKSVLLFFFILSKIFSSLSSSQLYQSSNPRLYLFLSVCFFLFFCLCLFPTLPVSCVCLSACLLLHYPAISIVLSISISLFVVLPFPHPLLRISLPPSLCPVHYVPRCPSSCNLRPFACSLPCSAAP